MTNRQAANKQFRAAQRAEEAYKAKKRSAGARKHSNDAKVHFQQSAHHLKEFFKSIGNLIMAGPWMYRAWQEKRREIADEKTKTRNAEKRKKLEEQLNKHAEEDKEIEV